MEEISFTDDQIERLRNLGVTERQIVRLHEMLPSFKAPLRAAAPLNEVRGELEHIGSVVRTAIDALASGLHNPNASPALREVQARLQSASVDRAILRKQPKAEPDEIGAAIESLNDALWVVRVAYRFLPAEQRRHRKATTLPIRMIEHCLLLGWAEEFNPVHVDDESSTDHKGAPAYPFAPSTNITGPFRQIVGVCYAAITGDAEADPERAIRSFVAEVRTEARHRAMIVNSAVFDT